MHSVAAQGEISVSATERGAPLDIGFDPICETVSVPLEPGMSATPDKGKSVEKSQAAQSALPRPRIRVGSGVTLGMGDYQSVRIDVSLEMPTQTTTASMEAMYGFAKRWVDGKMEAQIEEWCAENPKRRLPPAKPNTRR